MADIVLQGFRPSALVVRVRTGLDTISGNTMHAQSSDSFLVLKPVPWRAVLSSHARTVLESS